MAIPYASGFAAFRQPAFVPPAPSLPIVGIPLVRFPELSVPKLHRPAAVPAAATPRLLPPKHHVANTSTQRRVPVVSDTHTLATPSTQSSAKAPPDPFAKSAVVEDSVGTPPPPSPAAPTPAAATPPAATAAPGTDTAPATDAAPATPDAPATPATTTPSTATGWSRAVIGAPYPDDPSYATPAVSSLSFDSVAVANVVEDDPSSSATALDVPASPADDTIAPQATSHIQAPPVLPTTSGGTVPQSEDNIGVVSPPPLTAPNSPSGGETIVGTTSTGLDSTGAPVVGTTTVVSSTQQSTTTSGSTDAVLPNGSGPAVTTSGGSAGAGGASSGSPSSTSSSTGDDSNQSDGVTTANGVTPPPPDPAAVPGSGPSPPGLVTPDSGGTATAGDGSASVVFAPGLVTGSTVVSVTTTDLSPFGIRPASAAYDLTALDTTTGATISHFSGSPVLTISYDPSAPTPTAIYYLDPVNGPVALPSTVDTVHHTISAALPHFSTYIAGSAADVALALSPQIVQTSSSTTITATVTQGGVGAGGATVDFTTGGGAVFGGGISSCLTAADGTCTVTISDTATEAITVEANVEAASPPATASATVLFIPFSTSSLGTGQQSVSLGGFLQFSGTVDVESHGLVSAKLDDGSTAISGISLYTASLTSGTLFAGANAGTSSAAGLQGSISSLVAAFFFHGTDAWQAVTASFDASVTGIPGLTLSATGASVSYNGTSGGHALDLSQVDLSDGTSYGSLVVDSADFSSFTGSRVNVHADSAQVSAGGFVLAEGTVDVSDSSVTVTDPSLNGGTPTDATLLSVAVSGGDAFAGNGASFSGSTISQTGATGFYASSASVTVDVLKPTAADDTSFVGVSASIGSAGLEGVPGITLDVTGATATVNQATDSTGHATTSRIDWSNVPGSGLTIGRDVTFAVGGSAQLSAGGFVQAVGTLSLVDSTAPDSSTLMAGSLTGVQAFVGVGGSISGGSVVAGSVGLLATASEIDVGIDIVSPAVRHVGVEAKGLAGSITGLGSVVSFAVTGLDAQVNPDAFDWATFAATVLGAPAFTMTGSLTLGASGTAAISAGSFVEAAGSFALRDSTLSGGSTLLTATLSAPGVFVGIGGGLSGFTVTPGTLGFSASASSVEVAVQVDGATTHAGVEVDGLDASLTGVPAITFAVEGLDAQVNPDAVDWHALDSSLSMDGSVTLAASGTAEASAAGFVAVAGGFTLTKSGTALVVKLTGASAFVGVGGSVSGFAVTPGSPGFSLTAAEVDVALQGGHYGVQVTDASGSLVGVPAITFDVEHLNAT